MAATFNHISLRRGKASVEFYRTLLEAREAPSWGPFSNLLLEDGVLLQFADPSVEFTPAHLAFLLDDDHIDRAYKHIRGASLEHRADTQQTQPGETNTEHGGQSAFRAGRLWA